MKTRYGWQHMLMPDEHELLTFVEITEDGENPDDREENYMRIWGAINMWPDEYNRYDLCVFDENRKMQTLEPENRPTLVDDAKEAIVTFLIERGVIIRIEPNNENELGDS